MGLRFRKWIEGLICRDRKLGLSASSPSWFFICWVYKKRNEYFFFFFERRVYLRGRVGLGRRE